MKCPNCRAFTQSEFCSTECAEEYAAKEFENKYAGSSTWQTPGDYGI